MNQGIHTIDLLRLVAGPPGRGVRLRPAAWPTSGIEVEDTAVAIVRFESGALGVVHGTTAAYPGLAVRLQVHGTRGSAVIDDDQLEYFHAAPAEDDPDAPAYGAGMSSNQASLVLPQEESAPSAGADPAALSDAHDLQYADFLRAVRAGREPAVTPADAALTLQVVLAIYRSVRGGTAGGDPCRQLSDDCSRKPSSPDCRGGPKEAETSDGRDRSATAEADDLRRARGRRRGALDGLAGVLPSRPGQPATAERDLRRGARRLGYRSEALPGLVGQRTRSLALVVTDITNPFYCEIIRGAHEAARRVGLHDPALAHPGGRASWSATGPSGSCGAVEGVLLTSSRMSD